MIIFIVVTLRIYLDPQLTAHICIITIAFPDVNMDWSDKKAPEGSRERMISGIVRLYSSMALARSMERRVTSCGMVVSKSTPYQGSAGFLRVARMVSAV